MLVKGAPSLSPSKGHVLLIQLGDIGDVVLTIPALKALRRHFPKRKLIVVVREQAGELMAEAVWPDEVLTVKKGHRGPAEWIAYQTHIIKALAGNRFYLAIDLRTGTRGAVLAALSTARYRIGRFAEPAEVWRNRVFTHLVRPEGEKDQYAAEHNLNIITPFGWHISDIQPTLMVTGLRKKRAIQLLKEAGVPEGRPCIAVHPFSLWAYKGWRQDRVVALIEKIKARYDVSIIITGAPYEADRVMGIIQGSRLDVVPLAGKTTIGDLPAVLQRCVLFIGVDTAALHIAAAVGTPTLSIFGPSSPVNWAPRGETHTVITRQLACQPCRQKGCEDSEISRCLNELDTETVFQAVENRLQQGGLPPGILREGS